MNYNVIGNKEVNKFIGAIKRNDLKFYQFYNIEFAPDEYQFQEFMQTFKEGDSTVKILNKSYYDIEVFYDPAVFPDAEKAGYMVNAVAVYNNIKNTAVIFTCPYYKDIHEGTKHSCNETDKDILEAGVREMYADICIDNPTYDIPDIRIEVRVFDTESELLKDFFVYLRKIYSLFLMGFNSSLFDDPYVVNRGLNLIGEPVYKYISEFGEVQKYGNRTYEWPDYAKVDLLSMYKPVDQGGGGLGKSLPNYKLNTVAEKELGITKLDIGDMNDSYKNNLVEFLTYNLLDTLLTFKLDEKLQFLELNYMLAKLNNAPVSSSIQGRSIMYKYRNNLIYTKRNQLVRAKGFGREIFYPLPINN